MPYDPKAIANYFLTLASAEGKELTPMKIQKLVYFAHGWHMAIYGGSPLIDEQIEAWKFGPVIPSLYRTFRDHGNSPITEPASDYLIKDPEETFDEIEYCKVTPSLEDDPAAAPKTKALLDRIWSVYGAYSAIELSNMTHQPGTPWEQIYRQYGGALPRGTDIPAESIRTYFRGLARKG